MNEINMCKYNLGNDDGCIVCGYAGLEMHVDPKDCEDCGWYIKRKPNMREKVREYIDELDEEISRCESWVEENMNIDACKVTAMETRARTLKEVKCDLESRLEELA